MRSTCCMLFVLAVSACATFRPMVAGPRDLEDYRAFRVAAAEGTRLARAQTYLKRHPTGAFADEVRHAFDEEEPRFFEACQANRSGAQRYLTDLPDGPHASAALALLNALESNMEEAALLDVIQKARGDEARFESAAALRRRVGEAILSGVGVLLDDGVYGISRADAPPALRSVLTGSAASTWGALPGRRDEDLFFTLPTRPAPESRLLTLEFSIVEDDDRIVSGKVSGDDMFVRWLEADKIVRVDPTSIEDRTEAQVHAMDRLGGALERRFPAATCTELRGEKELYHRKCEGWEVVVVPGSRAGDKDSIVVRGAGRRSSRE